MNKISNNFITHTVQMEHVVEKILILEELSLYNPHGSDGTVNRT
jgi:hypothetical protein